MADAGRRLACAALLSAPLLARAALREAIVRIKPSIVVVGTLMRSRAPAFELKGTGFVVGNGTLIATNAHVKPGDSIRIPGGAKVAAASAVETKPQVAAVPAKTDAKTAQGGGQGKVQVASIEPAPWTSR